MVLISAKGFIIFSILDNILKLSGKKYGKVYQLFHLLGIDTDPDRPDSVPDPAK
jgi:hypothetical protein